MRALLESCAIIVPPKPLFSHSECSDLFQVHEYLTQVVLSFRGVVYSDRFPESVVSCRCKRSQAVGTSPIILPSISFV